MATSNNIVDMVSRVVIEHFEGAVKQLNAEAAAIRERADTAIAETVTRIEEEGRARVDSVIGNLPSAPIYRRDGQEGSRQAGGQMMSKLAQNYPQLRIAIYGLVAAALLAAGIFGYVTEDQAARILSLTTSVLGTLGLVLASMNVKNPGPVVTLEPSEYEVHSPLDPADIARQVAAQLNYGVAQGRAALDTANASVADIRRQAEQMYGEFRGQ